MIISSHIMSKENRNNFIPAVKLVLKKISEENFLIYCMVGILGLEPRSLSALVFETSVLGHFELPPFLNSALNLMHYNDCSVFNS